MCWRENTQELMSSSAGSARIPVSHIPRERTGFLWGAGVGWGGGRRIGWTFSSSKGRLFLPHSILHRCTSWVEVSSGGVQGGGEIVYGTVVHHARRCTASGAKNSRSNRKKSSLFPLSSFSSAQEHKSGAWRPPRTEKRQWDSLDRPDHDQHVVDQRV